MKRIVGILFLSSAIGNGFSQTGQPPAPDKVYGSLFEAVQMNRIFPDNKTFVDCTPKRHPDSIMADYKAMSNDPAIRFSLKAFVANNFNMPDAPPSFVGNGQEGNTATHINNLWPILKRQAATGQQPAGSSLLPLPYPYIVPGGRFREIYYWDSYFTMLGLKESGNTDVIENMVNNFAYLINTYGHIPNGNRSYYLSRSQPPFFSLMVQLLASIKGDGVYKTYLPALEKEYEYWMDKTAATKHVVKMPDGSTLNRYYDRDAQPRQESYYEDFTLGQQRNTDADKSALFRNLRSGAESGWDFSSRWFADANSLATIQVTDMIPVDLNSLLYNLELVLSQAKKMNGYMAAGRAYSVKAEKRRQAIEKYCWNAKTGYYFDYNIKSKKQSSNITAAGVFPLCFINLYPESMDAKGAAVAKVLQQHLLKEGGIVTTTNTTGQQWDAPNGWAPLQWMTAWALSRSGQTPLAKDIAQRWTALNEKVYANTGKLMEKYNVENITLPAGGGEYPSQDGFGWTNGVYLAMKSLLAGKYFK